MNAVYPKLVKTQLTENTPYGSSTKVGAQKIVKVAEIAKGGPRGEFLNKDGSVGCAKQRCILSVALRSVHSQI